MRERVLTLAQLHAIIDADRGVPLHWHVPVPRAGLGVLLATWMPVLALLAVLAIAAVRR